MGFVMTISKIVMVVAAAGLVSSAALANRSGSPIHEGKQAVFQKVMKMRGEAFVTGNGESTALTQFSFTPLDSGTVLNCKKACVVSAEVTTQMNTGGADWAICIVVDGSNIECQYQGVQSGPSSFVTGNATGNASVAAGNHTFQTQLYSESTTATYQYYAMHYAVNQ